MHQGHRHRPPGGAGGAIGVLLCLVLGLSLLTVRLWPAPASPSDFVPIADVPTDHAPHESGPDASTGTYTEDCGHNEQGHRNADNVVISPGNTGGAHHVHDYVGNLSTDALSTDASLAAAGTSCAGGDLSSYYWPVLRRTDRTGGGAGHDEEHGPLGEILTPEGVTIRYLGNRWAKVVAMPRYLRLLEGDPTAATDGGADARARWGCTGYPDRTTDRYPLCPASNLLTRTLDFPSCWDGRSIDSGDHRSHVLHPTAAGICPHDTFPIPHLQITVAYRPPPPGAFALDAFPEQHHSPRTDHAVFIGLMSEGRATAVAACLNDARDC